MKCSVCNNEGHNKRTCNQKTQSEITINNCKVLFDGQTTQSKQRLSKINIDAAEKSAREWVGDSDSPMKRWIVSAITDPKQHRDIGKVLAYVAEIHVANWIHEKLGRPIKNVHGMPYDAITDDDEIPIKYQIKFRMHTWHLETTRRNSEKNKDTNHTGHIAYKKGEFDVLVIFKPGPSFGLSDSTIRCIPAHVLINPKKPDQLITNIPSKIRKIYDCDEIAECVVRSTRLNNSEY